MKWFGWSVLGLGALVVLTEIIAVQYVSGRPIGQYLVYDRAGPTVAVALSVGEDDLPVRAVMTAVGGRPMGARGHGGRPEANFELRFGNDSAIQDIRFYFPADRQLDTVTEYQATQSFLLAMDRPGDWRLSLSDAGFRQFEVSRVTATFRAGARGFSVLTLVIGSIVAAAGAIILMVAAPRRSRSG